MAFLQMKWVWVKPCRRSPYLGKIIYCIIRYIFVNLLLQKYKLFCLYLFKILIPCIDSFFETFQVASSYKFFEKVKYLNMTQSKGKERVNSYRKLKRSPQERHMETYSKYFASHSRVFNFVYNSRQAYDCVGLSLIMKSSSNIFVQKYELK